MAIWRAMAATPVSRDDPPSERMTPSPPAPAPMPSARCPRCGGVAGRRRFGSRANPFLSSDGEMGATCVDCGLDFEVDPERPPKPW
jgi:hypothetical protein